MKWWRKVLCKLKWHDEDLERIEIMPILVSQWKEVNEIVFPSRPGWMWKCKHCGNEKRWRHD